VEDHLPSPGSSRASFFEAKRDESRPLFAVRQRGDKTRGAERFSSQVRTDATTALEVGGGRDRDDGAGRRPESVSQGGRRWKEVGDRGRLAMGDERRHLTPHPALFPTHDKQTVPSQHFNSMPVCDLL
jgi:hypothetical protein